MKIGVAFQKCFEMIGMFRIAAHVRPDPDHIGKHFQHPVQRFVLLRLAAELGGVLIGVVLHQMSGSPTCIMTMRMPGFTRRAQARDAPRCIENIVVRGPRGADSEFDNLDAAFEKLFECAEGRILAFFGFLGDGSIEAKSVAEPRSQGRDILRRVTSV